MADGAEPDTAAPDTAAQSSGTDVVLSLRSIAKTYLAGDVEVAALRDVDVEVSRGEYVSILGPSGSGKSTLLNVLGLLDRPTAGSYVFEGMEVTDLDEQERTAVRGRRIGFVFQAFHLLSHRTVEDNVALSMLYTGVGTAERLRRAKQALESVGLAHRSSFLPTQLSGGERQRVAIARAIVTDPAVLLADEPTGNLDSVTSESILALFDDLRRRGLTIVMITHDAHVAARADRAVHIRDGRLTELPPAAIAAPARASARGQR
ncbi:ABC transporter ATP-binding protein [Demequina sp. B12]|uniref:ABC transporter ATP-binding protein n=1 Tax=Demequina sp. B12 TaxID=2992757 RepID=UPI00237B5C24|nr:ABC transporter ATP-binding protein [Demequina sp. B12]MDE0572651.1 ABC transporter ATP-binding protein [Demequina sp. B12]